MLKLPVFIAVIAALLLCGIPVYASDAPVELLVVYHDGQSPHELQALVDERSKNARASKWEEAIQRIDSVWLRLAKQMTPEQKLARLLQIETQLGIVLKHPVTIDDDMSRDVYLLRMESPYAIDSAASLYAHLGNVAYIEQIYP